MNDLAAPNISTPPPTHWRWEWLLIWASFALFASIRAPIPGVNEPHFLSKAKHFWDPSWCARDPFLESANAHYVFYATFGLLAQVLTLEQTAWIGRLFGWGFLASGWCALGSRLSSVRWFSLWSAWAFMGLAAIGNWSGEWVLGGIEAKVISYACVFWSLASVLAGQHIRGGAWAGLAVSFHPVVGIWHTGAAFLASITMLNSKNLFQVARSLVIAGIVWLLLAASGLIPALSLIRGGDPNQTYTADYIQVFHRLAHHLDPFKFQASSHILYGVLIALIIGFRFFTQVNWNWPAMWRRSATVTLATKNQEPRTKNQVPGTAVWKLLFRYAIIAALIAFGGLCVRSLPRIANWLIDLNVLPGLKDRLKSIVMRENHLAKWLKFYPFRLADVVIPLVLAMQFTQLFVGSSSSRVSEITNVDNNRLGAKIRAFVPWVVFGAILLAAILAAVGSAKNDSRLQPELFSDWRDVCRWVRRETPVDALGYVPSQGFGLKWYAERAEYVSFKDCPQDAAGIVAWNKRLLLIDKWSRQNIDGKYSRKKVQELRQSTGIDFVIVTIENPKLATFPIAPVYQNQSYQVIRLADAD